MPETQGVLFGSPAPEVINVASIPQLSPLRYPGGKTWFIPYLRRWLRAKKRRPSTLVEPYAGGAIASLTAVAENLVDRARLVELDSDVAAVWRCITSGSNAEKLAERIESFEMSRENVTALLKAPPSGCLVDAAFRTIVRNRVQHGGILAPGARMMNKGESGKGVGSRWYPGTLAKRIKAIASYGARIEFTYGDAVDTISSLMNDSSAAFFIDPPYTVAGRRLYTCCDIDHEELFRVIGRVSGDFVMTYDESEAIERMATEHGLKIKRVPMKSRQHSIKNEFVIGRDLSWL